MGVDQSKPGVASPGGSTSGSSGNSNLSSGGGGGRGTVAATLQEEDIPYTSYSAEKSEKGRRVNPATTGVAGATGGAVTPQGDQG